MVSLNTVQISPLYNFKYQCLFKGKQLNNDNHMNQDISVAIGNCAREISSGDSSVGQSHCAAHPIIKQDV